MKSRKKELERDRDPGRRQEILDAAALCFMTRGYYATTIDQIAAQNGSTKGLIYYHFASKTDLFFDVYRLAMQRTIDRAAPILADETGGAEKLRRLCEAHIVAMMNNLPYHHVANQGVDLHMQAALTSEQRATLLELFKLRDEYEGHFVSILEMGGRDGSLRCRDVRLTARTILGSLNSVSVWYRQRSSQTLAQKSELAAEITHVIMGGVLSSAVHG